MDLDEITQYVWQHSHAIKFGKSEGWDDDTFLHKWFMKLYPNEWIIGNDRPGWYWFSVDTNLQTEQLTRPDNLPSKARDFGLVSSYNNKLFGNEIANVKKGISVIYNGHESNVIGRIRAHFSVSNDKTGALGLKYYKSLSTKQWTVNIFMKQHLELDETLTETDRIKIKLFCESKTGRVAIEQMWRNEFGWPLLCKA